MTLVPVAQAQALALAHAAALSSESIAVGDAHGRIVAAPVLARTELPRADVSVMDGYATTLAALAHGRAPILGESAAGHPWPRALAPGAAVRISTGAVVPEGAELVVAQEDTRRIDDDIVFDAAVIAAASHGAHIRRAGCDLRRGEVLVDAGGHLGPAELALLAAAGPERIEVVRRPRVAILATGDELVAHPGAPGPGGVVETNGLMLRAACIDAGAQVVSVRVVGDERTALAIAIDDAIASADLVFTTGGASVGDHDHVRALAQRPGLEILAWGLALRPGKPTGIVRTGAGLWLALPGNPASTFVGHELLGRPVLRRMAGVRGDPRRPLRTMIAGAELWGERNREHWVRARIDGPRVFPLPDQASGNLRSIAGADALVRVPVGCLRIAAGASCEVLSLGHPEPRSWP